MLNLALAGAVYGLAPTPESQVRIRLPAGGSRIRTLGPTCGRGSLYGVANEVAGSDRADLAASLRGTRGVDEALAGSESNEERWCIAELLRVKGQLVLLEDAPDGAAMAEDHFRQALDWAQRQGALSWELRAATSLARMWRTQDRNKEVRELLVSVHDQFTEGFETADLKAAKALVAGSARPEHA
jgi:hypothetical protein